MFKSCSKPLPFVGVILPDWVLCFRASCLTPCHVVDASVGLSFDALSCMIASNGTRDLIAWQSTIQWERCQAVENGDNKNRLRLKALSTLTLKQLNQTKTNKNNSIFIKIALSLKVHFFILISFWGEARWICDSIT